MWAQYSRAYLSSMRAHKVKAVDLRVLPLQFLLGDISHCNLDANTTSLAIKHGPEKLFSDVDVNFYSIFSCQMNGKITCLITVCANDKDGCLGSMTPDRTEPEFQTSVLKAQSCCPQQQVDGTFRQEELQENRSWIIAKLIRAKALSTD